MVRSGIHGAVERPGADYCQSRLVTGIPDHIGRGVGGTQQVRGGASGAVAGYSVVYMKAGVCFINISISQHDRMLCSQHCVGMGPGWASAYGQTCASPPTA